MSQHPDRASGYSYKRIRATRHLAHGPQNERCWDGALPVANLNDLRQGKLWTKQDSARRASKRQKDLADIARLIEAYPHLRSRVPANILSRLV